MFFLVAFLIYFIRNLFRGIDDSRYDEMLELLKTIDIKVFPNGCGKYRAEALCPICQANGKMSKLSFAMDERRNWHIYSLTRHSNALHYPMPDSQRKRARTIKKEKGTPPKAIAENHLTDVKRSRHLSSNSIEINFSTSTDSNNDSNSVSFDPLNVTEYEVLNDSSEWIEESGHDAMKEVRIDDEQDGKL